MALSICERHRRHRDYTRHELSQALREIAACFPTYRSYVRHPEAEVSEADRRAVSTAVDRATEERPDLDPELLGFLRDLLLLRVPGALEGELAMRFQQLTGPAMAKGLEDTLFYRYNRLVCLNEVGGDPSRLGSSAADFHAFCARRQVEWPRAMLALSNHDTKRSADVRARLALLSEIPQRWGEAVARWRARNDRLRSGGVPDGNTEYLLYQTLVGAWPIGTDRLQAYMRKAVREAKWDTCWLRPDEAYEAALRDFIAGVMDDAVFCADIERFVAPLVWPGRINSLAQTLLMLTAPGVPHLYQGSELWDLSLVDPDNRRPVDFALRRRLLAECARLSPERILARADEGLPKLWLTRQALRLRREMPAAFGAGGAYTPLVAVGERAGHVVAYLRGDSVAVIVPRLVLVLGLGGDWRDTELALPAGVWRDRLGGGRIEGGRRHLGALLHRFPVALLSRGGDEV